MNKKRLYTDECVYGVEELEIEITKFVDNAIEKYGNEYNQADLELYITEAIMTRFAYHRIKTMVANKEKREGK